MIDNLNVRATQLIINFNFLLIDKVYKILNICV